MRAFQIEYTDTFSGEANYSWVRRITVRSVSFRGAVSKASRLFGDNFKLAWDSGDCVRYDSIHGCRCLFICQSDDEVTL